ncbi:MAG TPA: YceI family protein [Tepidisphaeraceae bacterium]|jgi:polyisoprenoid-binding protein YceI
MRPLTVLALLAVMTAAPAFAQTFAIDPVHTSLLFKVKHFDTSNFYGRFRRVGGNVTVTDGRPSALEVTAEADSVDTNNRDRDAHLAGPDFFDAKQFPAITFKAKTFTPAGEAAFKVDGDLTLHGVTKPVTVTLTRTGQGKNVKGTDIVGYETTLTIRRTDFGVSGYVSQGIGDDVTLIVSIEGVRQ